jgi:hypothetical protein
MNLQDSPFYLMREANGTKCTCDSAPGSLELEKITCPFQKGHQRAGRRLTMLDVIVPCHAPPDFLFTWASNFLIQSRLLSSLRAANLKGFHVSPARARSKRTAADISVSEFSVMGWAGQVAQASGVQEDQRCSACGFLHYTDLTNADYLIDLNAWDGSDFFIIWPLPKFIFVTQRVVDLFKSEKFKGVKFVKNFSLLPCGFSPGRLSQWMPLERAHALGDALGIF